MVANRVLFAILMVSAWVVIPLQLLTTLVLGLMVWLTFGLLLLPLSFIFLLMWGPLVALSWLGARVRYSRELVGLLGLPLAVVAEVYVALMPSMGELENRAAKMLLVRCYPYSWEFLRFETGHLDIESPEAASLLKVLNRVARDTLSRRVVGRIARGEPLH